MNIDESEELFFKYIYLINRQQHDFLREKYDKMNAVKKIKFFKDIIENGIFVHQAPFFGYTDMDSFKEIFTKIPEICKPYEFVGIEKPMVLGSMYFIRLKHESSNKMSMRSTSIINIKNLPAKSTMKKQKRVLYSSTPIRFGEMEVANLYMTKQPKVVEKFLKSYSTSSDDRQHLVEDLITSKDPMKLNFKLSRETSINRNILNKYLSALELELEDD